MKFHGDDLQVTFCSVMHSIMGVDGEGNPLAPLIIWADTRSRQKRELLEIHHGKEMFYRKTRCPLHSTYWPARILWLKQACAGLDDGYYVVGEATNGAGISLKWLADVFRYDGVPCPENELLFIPTLMGEKGPSY